jgi:hypothetical protein
VSTLETAAESSEQRVRAHRLRRRRRQAAPAAGASAGVQDAGNDCHDAPPGGKKLPTHSSRSKGPFFLFTASTRFMSADKDPPTSPANRALMLLLAILVQAALQLQKEVDPDH